MSTFYRRSDHEHKPPVHHIPPKSNPWWWVGIICVVLLYFIYYHWQKEPAPSPGVLVPEEPVQKNIKGSPFAVGEYVLTPIATFSIRARVLSVAQYSSDTEAALSPVDFALGWGEMSNSSLLNLINISQDGRWYFWSYKQKLRVSNNYIALHSANMHIIPANDEVREIAETVQKNNIIRMRGYLVTIKGKDGYTWTSSTTREDSGANSCEVVWVESLTIEQ